MPFVTHQLGRTPMVISLALLRTAIAVDVVFATCDTHLFETLVAWGTVAPASVLWVAATSLLLVSLVLTIQTGIPAVPGVLAAVVMLCFPLASLGGSL